MSIGKDEKKCKDSKSKENIVHKREEAENVINKMLNNSGMKDSLQIKM